MSKSAAFKAACLGAGLATAWNAAPTKAAQYLVTGSGSTSVSLSHVTLIVGDLTVAIPDDQPDGSSALTSAHWGGTLVLSSGGTVKLLSTPWELAGLAGDPAAGDVMVAFSSPPAPGTDFAAVFPGQTEAVIADLIRRKDSLDLAPFFASLPASSGATLGTSSTAVEFSGATPIGTVTIDIAEVPEPGALMLVGTGLLGLLRRRRR